MTTKEKTGAARAAKSKDTAARDMTALTNHVGMILREARETRGINVDMVADELMIRRFYLDALEQGSFKDLPERVYATGFVRAYATYLGLDVAQLLDQFKREAYGTRNNNYQVELVMPEPIVHSVVPNRSAILSAVVAVVLIIGGVIFATRNHVSETASIPELPAAQTEAAATQETAPAPAPVAADTSVAVAPAAATTTENAPESEAVFDVPSPEATTETAPASAASTKTDNTAAAMPATASTASLPDVAPAGAPKNAIVLEALQSSWVEVKDMQGTVLFTSILKAGQLLPLPEQPVSVTTGNAGGLRPVVDGVVQPALGQMNEVKRNVKLDPSQLRQR